jgi:hypothetical protein
MRLAALRLAGLVAALLIFSMAFAHVMELPGKLRLDGPSWLTVQHNVYIAFGPAGAVLEPLAIVLAWLLVFALRRQGRRYRLALLAAVCMTIGLVEWALVVQPMNTLLNHWTAATLPPDWTACRDRWELGHAIHAGLFAVAAGALLGSALYRR